jgi:sugar/nucleoside kinase (ribokinase family)
MPDHCPELVAVGHIICETIYFPDRTIGPVLGSPPAYSAVAAARLGIRVGIVTRIGPDFPRELIRIFDEAGIDTAGVKRGGKSTCTELRYAENGNKEIRFPSRADPIDIGDFPPSYRHCRMIYVCTMEDDVSPDKLGIVSTFGTESAIDLGGYGGAHMSGQRRRRIPNGREYSLGAARHFNFVKASDEDCRIIFGEDSKEAYARRLLTGKVKASLVTLGKDGVIIGTANGCEHVPAVAGRPVDVTGGGDTFMGGFLSEYIRTGDVSKSAIFGSATAMCAIERTGGVLSSRMPTEQEVRTRLPRSNSKELL